MQEYSIYDLGYDKDLSRSGDTPSDIQPSIVQDLAANPAGGTFSGGLSDPIEKIVNPETISSGSLASLLYSGKQTFSDTTAGYRMGKDIADGIYKWIIGDGTSSVDWAVTTAGTLTVKGTIVAAAGTIGTWYINATTLSSTATASTSGILLDAGNQQIRVGSSAGNYILLDGPNLRIRSSNYVAGVSGFTIEPTLIEAENIVARGTLRGVSFKYDVISAVGGQLIVSNSDALASDMTALDASTLTVRGDTTFAVNDILHIKAVTASGIQEEWMRVTNIGSAPTYTMTRDLAAAFTADNNPAWKAGTAVVKEGVSDGAASYSGGWLRLLGQGTNSPYYSVYARNGVAYNASTEAVRLGNLNGIGSFVADTYGIYIGNSSTGNYLTYDTTSGNLVVNDSILSNQDIFGDGSDGNVTISGDTTLSSDMFYNNLTVNNTKNLDAGGYRIFVKGTLTNNGTIHANGNAGTNGTSTAFFSAGTAGTGGTARSDGSLKGALAGKDGVNGVAGVLHAGAGAFTPGNNGLTGNNGVNVTKSLVSSNGISGKTSGNSGLCNGNAGGTAGAGGSGGTITGTVLNKIKNAIAAYLLTEFLPSGTVQIIDAAPSNGGSGSGGSGAALAAAGSSATSGGTGGVGGNGGNGGICWIAAKKIVNAGTISANGGAAGSTGTSGSGQLGGGGNGATGGSAGSAGANGGNGGAVILMYGSLTNTGTIQAAGGAGSNGAAGAAGTSNGGYTSTNGTAGTNGSSGNAGVTLQLQI